MPFFWMGIPSGHDFEFHFNSWIEVAAQWRQGILYPRWAALAQQGYGEARFIFYPPASWMLGAAIGTILPWKLAAGVYSWFALSLAGVSMFLLAREWMDRGEALFAAVCYACNPYFIVLIYWRSAFAELLAGTLVPLLALFILRQNNGAKRHVVLPLACVIACAWLTNVPSAVMVTYSAAFLILVIAMLRHTFRILLQGAAGIILGMLLAGFYLFPAFVEKRWVNVGEALSGGYRPQDNFLFTITPDISHTQFNHFISIVAVIQITACVFAGIFLFRRFRTRAPQFLTVALWGGLLSLSMISFTSIFWKWLPELTYMQFPWRWLLCLNVPLALFAGAAWRSCLPRLGFLTVLLGATFFLTGKSLPPWWDHAPDIAEMLDNQSTGAGYEGTDEYVPATADPSQVDFAAPKTVYHGAESAQVSVIQWGAIRKILRVASNAPGNLTLRLFNYPAWRVTVNGRPIYSQTSAGAGQMMVPVVAGTNDIDVRFGSTWDRRVGEALSLISFAGVLSMLLWQRSREQVR